MLRGEENIVQIWPHTRLQYCATEMEQATLIKASGNWDFDRTQACYVTFSGLCRNSQRSDATNGHSREQLERKFGKIFIPQCSVSLHQYFILLIAQTGKCSCVSYSNIYN